MFYDNDTKSTYPSSTDMICAPRGAHTCSPSLLRMTAQGGVPGLSAQRNLNSLARCFPFVPLTGELRMQIYAGSLASGTIQSFPFREAPSNLESGIVLWQKPQELARQYWGNLALKRYHRRRSLSSPLLQTQSAPWNTITA